MNRAARPTRQVRQRWRTAPRGCRRGHGRQEGPGGHDPGAIARLGRLPRQLDAVLGTPQGVPGHDPAVGLSGERAPRPSHARAAGALVTQEREEPPRTAVSGADVGRPMDPHRRAESVVELRVLPAAQVLAKPAEPLEQLSGVPHPVQQALHRRCARHPPKVERDVFGPGEQVPSIGVGDRAGNGERAGPVLAQARRRPARLRQAVRGEEGNIGRARRVDSQVPGPAGIQTLLPLDDGDLEARSPQRGGGIATAGVHHHDLDRLILRQERADGPNQARLRRQAQYHTGEVVPLPLRNAGRPIWHAYRPSGSYSRPGGSCSRTSPVSSVK